MWKRRGVTVSINLYLQKTGWPVICRPLPYPPLYIFKLSKNCTSNVHSCKGCIPAYCKEWHIKIRLLHHSFKAGQKDPWYHHDLISTISNMNKPFYKSWIFQIVSFSPWTPISTHISQNFTLREYLFILGRSSILLCNNKNGKYKFKLLLLPVTHMPLTIIKIYSGLSHHHHHHY